MQNSINQNYNTVDKIEFEKGEKVIVRVDYNVPISGKGGAAKVTDTFRISQSIKTLAFLLRKGAVVIAISHIESGEGTLKPVVPHLIKMLKENVPSFTDENFVFCEDIIPDGQVVLSSVKPGSLVLAENIRQYDGEKKNDADFANDLSKLGDYYVNEAFSVSHRKHASVNALPLKFPNKRVPRRFVGFEFDNEIKNLSVAFNPPHPFLWILGGAKFETKLPLIQKFANIADIIFVGGAIAHNFFKENNQNIGASLVSPGFYDTKNLITKSKAKIVLPKDARIKDKNGNRYNGSTDKVQDGEVILDAGKETLEDLAVYVRSAECIVWNGPLGNFEVGDGAGTLALAKIIGTETKKSCVKIVGGGDTISAIQEQNISENFTFISTGGGAMLDYLANGTLPGLDVLLTTPSDN